MAHKISKKVIACILVLAFMLQSIPVLMFMAFGEFAAENLFQTHLDKAASFGVSMIIDSGRVEKNGRFSADVIGASVDGDKDASTFVGGMNADTPARYMGAVYVLEDVYYLDKLTFFSGDKGYPDSYRVYVSETLADTEKFADLFSEGNRINSKDVACEVDQQELPIGRRAKYVAVIHTGTEGARVREFELWSPPRALSWTHTAPRPPKAPHFPRTIWLRRWTAYGVSFTRVATRVCCTRSTTYIMRIR